MARWESRWCKSTLPLCHSNPDPFLNECYPGCSGYARPPVSIPSTPLLTLPLAYFSADSRRIETKIRDIFPFSPLFSFSKKKKKKKRKTQQRCEPNIVGIVVRAVCCFRFFLFFGRFDKISLLVRKRRDEKTKFVNFSSPSFFFLFSINFNSSFQKHLFCVIANNV